MIFIIIIIFKDFLIKDNKFMMSNRFKNFIKIICSKIGNELK